MAKYTPDGRFEIPDPVPVELPVGYRRPLSMEELIQQSVRLQVSAMASQQGAESFEEADDFEDDGDGEVVLSPYQLRHMAKAKKDLPPGYLPDASEGSLGASNEKKVSTQPDGSKNAPEPD